MIVIGADILVACMERHARSRKQIAAWHAEAKAAAWRTPNDIKARFRSADFFRIWAEADGPSILPC